ncbi:MAG TPA: sugar phosphate isomerase/epimerase [Kiritimatiellia bacterium]|nr:sugar phosphate isomerase/epimerase [Kiritimatiellia bacterium]
MSTKPISIQLYSLREEAKTDFPGVLRRVAEIGFRGVEPAGFHGLTPAAFRRMVEDLGMVISSTHSPWATPDNLQETIDTLGVLGVDLVAAGVGQDDFRTVDTIRATAERFAAMDEQLSHAGITMTVHNHWWEFERIDGRLKMDILLEHAPRLRLELDTYWACNFGANDAAEMVRRHGARSPLLHIKDGTLRKDEPLVAVGAGRNDIRGIVAALDPAVTRWLVVEQDNSATDMFECMRASYNFMVGNGLASGRINVG